MVALGELRSYLKYSSESEVIKQIENIQDMTLLRALLEAGLRPRLLDAVTKKADELL